MTTTTAPKVKLVCIECRRENEAERIYCHGCGARLDRSKLAEVEPPQEDPKETQRRLQAMFDARRAKLRRAIFDGVKLVVAAGVIAVVVQMFRPPDMPPVKAAPGTFPPQVSLDLGNAEMDPRVGPIRYSEDDINLYLASAMKSKKTALSHYLKFDRLVVHFDEGTCRATLQRSLYGVPFCTSVTFAPTIQNTAIGAKCKGGAIGRLPVHPLLMQYGDILFADVRKALERERKSIAKLGAVELHPQTIVISRRAL